jgi:hypothetical protein
MITVHDFVLLCVYCLFQVLDPVTRPMVNDGFLFKKVQEASKNGLKYETMQALLDDLSPAYRQAFASRLLTRLGHIADQQE